jgi:hypothetical protein
MYCLDLQTDVNNCGACGNACPAGHTCIDGACACADTSCCPAGQVYCPKSVVGVAGCTDVQTDPYNCGGCAAQLGGICGLLDSKVCCGGTCLDTLSDPTNCGACGNHCNHPFNTGVCALGVCTMQGCPNGYADCDGNAGNGCEANLNNDPNNCGACGNVCPGQADGAICLNGSCCIKDAGVCQAGGLGCCHGNNCNAFNSVMC